MASNFFQRLGEKFLLVRETKLRWSRLKAAQKAGIDSGTVRRIELGENFKADALDAYALALGRPLDEWIRDLVIEHETQRAAATTSAMAGSLQRTGTDSYAGPPPAGGGPERRQHPDVGHGPHQERRRHTDPRSS